MTATATPGGPNGTGSSKSNAGQNISLTSSKPVILKERSFYDASEGFGVLYIAVNDTIYKLFVKKRKDRVQVYYNGEAHTLREVEKGEIEELKQVGREVAKLINGFIFETTTIRQSRFQRLFEDVGNEILVKRNPRNGDLLIRYGDEYYIINNPRSIRDVINQLMAQGLTDVNALAKVRNAVVRALVSVDSTIVERTIYHYYMDRDRNYIAFMYPIKETGERLSWVVTVLDKDGGLISVEYFNEAPTFTMPNGAIVTLDVGSLRIKGVQSTFNPDIRAIREAIEELKRGVTYSTSEVFKKMKEYILNHALPANDASLINAASWAITRYIYQVFDRFPHLCIMGAYGTGKTRMSETVVESQLYPLLIANLTEAGAVRLIQVLRPAMVLNELEKRIRDETYKAMINSAYEKAGEYLRADKETQDTVWLYPFYDPMVITYRPEEGEIPYDTLSRCLFVMMSKMKARNYRPPSEDELRELKKMLIIYKSKYWRKILDAADLLSERVVGIDQRVRDTWMPPLIISYLIAIETGDRALFKAVLRDMYRHEQFFASPGPIYSMVAIGILRKLLKDKHEYDRERGVIRVKHVEVWEYGKGYLAGVLGVNVDDRREARKYMDGVVSVLNTWARSREIVKNVVNTSQAYEVSIPELHWHVYNENYDISVLNDSERDDLTALTGLDWRSINREDWWVDNVVRCVLDKDENACNALTGLAVRKPEEKPKAEPMVAGQPEVKPTEPTSVETGQAETREEDKPEIRASPSGARGTYTLEELFK